MSQKSSVKDEKEVRSDLHIKCSFMVPSFGRVDSINGAAEQYLFDLSGSGGVIDVAFDFGSAAKK